MITGVDVANSFLEQGFREDISISPMKLQKLIYILFKEYYKETGFELFTEPFEAWQYGPVLPNVYREFKVYGANPIKHYASNSDFSISKVNIIPCSPFDSVFRKVWHKYKHKSGMALSQLTHIENGAWDKAVKNKTYILQKEDIRNEVSYE